MRDFDPLDYARGELAPLLRLLCDCASDDSEKRQSDFFAAILRGIQMARDPADLMDPFLQLSTSAFQGFHFGPEARLLLDQLLERAQLLSEALSREGLPLQ